jgi:hypothetical protein
VSLYPTRLLGITILGATLLAGCIAPVQPLPSAAPTQGEDVGITVTDLINQQLAASESLVVVDEIERKLPEDINSGQIGGYFQLGAASFALVRQPSMNVVLELPQDYQQHFTGLLLSVDGTTWQKYLELGDAQTTDKNNPYWLWREDGMLYLSIVDQSGGGSGEGILKLEQYMDGKWQLAGCYYFGANYYGAAEEGDYFASSQKLGQQQEQAPEACQNVKLIVHS